MEWELENSEIQYQGYVVFKEDQNNVLLPYVKLSKNNTLFEKVSPGIYKYQIRAYTIDGIVIKSDLKEFEFIDQNK